MNNMIEALERIAAYPRSRSEEISIGTAREIARTALASQSQQTEKGEAIAQYLYQLLDDIDTAGDIAKENDKAYREIVERIQSKKSKVVESCDGYTVVFKLPPAPEGDKK